jgi:hypothetical protein
MQGSVIVRQCLMFMVLLPLRPGAVEGVTGLLHIDIVELVYKWSHWLRSTTEHVFVSLTCIW